MEVKIFLSMTLGKLKANITDKNRCKNPQQNISKWDLVTHSNQEAYIMVKWNLSQDTKMFDFHKLINVINCLDKLKNKNHIIISTDAGKVLTKFNIHL